MQQILQHYYPRLDEVSPETIRETRVRLRNHYRAKFEDLDMDPNSVFGDLWLTPAATHIAALDIALTRYKSDLDLANVAEGVIWDCEFVEKYLKNFAPTTGWDTSAYGVARLTFNAGTSLSLPRNLLFDAGGSIYRMRLPEEGPLHVREQGTLPTPGVNEVFLTATNTAWIVDVSLVGSETDEDPPQEGTSLSLSQKIPGLVSAVALHTFSTGGVSLNLSSIARITRETVYAATLGTKGGVSSFFRRTFPSYIGVHTTCHGDDVMVRPSSIRPVDIYTRSMQLVLDNINIRMKLNGSFFEGEIFLPAIPLLFGQVTSANAPGVFIGDHVEFFYKSSDEARAPGWSGAYSTLQRIWMRVEMPLDPVTNDPLIITEIEGVDEYAVFNIPYYQDPGFRAAADLLQSEENKPVYTDLLVKSPCVVHVNSLVVRYKRKPGTKVAITSAKNDIRDYVNTVMFPQVFSDARIADIMFFSGAVDVLNIQISAEIRYSPANKMFTDLPDPSDFTSAAATAVSMPVTNINTTEGLKITYIPEVTAAVSPENMHYFLPVDNITLEEV